MAKNVCGVGSALLISLVITCNIFLWSVYNQELYHVIDIQYFTFIILYYYLFPVLLKRAQFRRIFHTNMNLSESPPIPTCICQNNKISNRIKVETSDIGIPVRNSHHSLEKPMHDAGLQASMSYYGQDSDFLQTRSWVTERSVLMRGMQQLSTSLPTTFHAVSGMWGVKAR